MSVSPSQNKPRVEKHTFSPDRERPTVQNYQDHSTTDQGSLVSFESAGRNDASVNSDGRWNLNQAAYSQPWLEGPLLICPESIEKRCVHSLALFQCPIA